MSHWQANSSRVESHCTCAALQSADSITVSWCYQMTITGMCQTARLIGFCDASSKAYAAVIYLRIEVDNNVNVTFVAAKTSVTPIRSVSIPRLELLSTLCCQDLWRVLKVHSSLSYNWMGLSAIQIWKWHFTGYKARTMSGSNLLEI